MIDKIYLYSTDFGDGPELIGVIDKQGDEYTFAYADPESIKWYQIIKPYKDVYKIYGTEVVKSLFRRLIPLEDDFYTPDYLKQYNMIEYNEWELLIRFISDSHISFGKPDCTGNVYWATKLSDY